MFSYNGKHLPKDEGYSAQLLSIIYIYSIVINKPGKLLRNSIKLIGILRLKFLIFLFFLIIPFFNFQLSFSQINLDNWVNYSSMLDSKTLSIDSKGRIWAGGNGGVFYYHPSTGDYKEFSNINALLSLDITKVKCNLSDKSIYIGAFDGTLDIVTEDLKWTHITDIKISKFSNSRINDIVFYDNLAFIGGGFGLTVFDKDKKVFTKTPRKLGSFQPNTIVNNILVTGSEIWVATEAGIAVAPINSRYENYEVWKNYTKVDRLPDDNILFLAETGGFKFAASRHAISKMVNDTFYTLVNLPDYEDVLALFELNNQLLYVTKYKVATIDNREIFFFTSHPDSSLINTAITDSNGNLILSFKDNGIGIIENNKLKTYVPNTPNSNLFLSLAVDLKGNLWAATDAELKGRGFMKFGNGEWTNFTYQKYPEMIDNSYHKVSLWKGGKIALSNWGKGLVILSEDENSYKFDFYNKENTCLNGFPGALSYVVTGEGAIDPRNGKLWITNWGNVGTTGPILGSLDDRGNFKCINNAYSPDNRSYMSIAVDFSGTKWLGSRGSTSSAGIYYYNEGATDSPNDDKQGILTTSSGLPSNEINCIELDRSGWLWVGTPSGIARILFPSNVLKDSKVSVFTLKSFGEKIVNDILIDALNYVWVATNEGVYVIDPEQGMPVANFNKQNSPLISDEILSIATDVNTGRMYFGTRNGLSTASSFSILPREDYSINCYPQPFDPERDDFLTIDGLASDSKIKILTINGQLVKTLQTTGRKITWDGKTELGETASTGIYIIVVSSLSSNASAVSKFAIVRQKK